MNPRFDLTGEIGCDTATGAAIGAFCDANPGPIDVFINSFGGIATEGAAIFAALERHGNATALVQGVAASAASLAMLGAKQVLIADSALVMIHEPGAVAFGTSSDMRAMAATLEKMTAVYAAIYSRVAAIARDRKSTRLNSSHDQISYAVFCLKKKNTASKQTCNQVHRTL